MTAPILKIKVTPKPVVKGKMDVRFPAKVDVEAFLTVLRENGIYTFGVDYTLLDPAPLSDPDTALIAVFDGSTQSWKRTTLAALISVPEEPIIVTASSAVIDAGTNAVAVNRSAPSATGLTLPSVFGQDGQPIRIFDWSTSITDHTITLTPFGAQTIMRAATWPLYSTAVSRAGVTLYPSTDLNGWYIAP
jgi:hypothetical protein